MMTATVSAGIGLSRVQREPRRAGGAPRTLTCIKAPRSPAAGALFGNRPGVDQVMRDRHGEGRLQPLRVGAGEHLFHLRAGEPAAVLQFHFVAVDLGRKRLGMAADHQRGWEGPRLARVVAHPPDADAGSPRASRGAPHPRSSRRAP